MKLEAQANLSQLDEVEITISTTMKLKEWKIIREAVRTETKNNYHWTKAEFANRVQDVIDEYASRIESTVIPRSQK